VHGGDVHRGEALVGDDLVDDVAVGVEHGVLPGVRADLGADRRALEAAAELAHGAGDLGGIGRLAQHRRRVAIRPDDEQRHGGPPCP
jgi:hypothetical protein